ncbi:hypothetical protein [uncultured Trichococcus sp.]|uniref:hypothetical protein n=1 Tax=uncultured Trichococcus sp. TaxID=189665 RepID=UPI0029C74DC0|nr:hypothetical protein [uncultured Trichococcus sp.]
MLEKSIHAMLELLFGQDDFCSKHTQEWGHPILKILSNPVVIPILLLLAGSGIWWLLTNLEKTRKAKLLSKLSDELFRLLALAFGSNALLHFSEVLRAPYQALLLTKEAVFVAVIITGTYNLWKQLPKLLADRALLVALLQLLLLLLSINHLFYYSLYENPTSIGLAGLGLLLLLAVTFIPMRHSRLAGMLVSGAIAHFALMNGKSILYFGLVVMPELILASVFAFILVFLVRGKVSSKQI